MNQFHYQSKLWDIDRPYQKIFWELSLIDGSNDVIPLHAFAFIVEHQEPAMHQYLAKFISMRGEKSLDCSDKDVDAAKKDWYEGEIAASEDLCERSDQYGRLIIQDLSDKLELQKYIDWCNDQLSMPTNVVRKKTIEHPYGLTDFFHERISVSQRENALEASKAFVLKKADSINFLIFLSQEGLIPMAKITANQTETAFLLSEFYNIEVKVDTVNKSVANYAGDRPKSFPRTFSRFREEAQSISNKLK